MFGFLFKRKSSTGGEAKEEPAKPPVPLPPPINAKRKNSPRAEISPMPAPVSASAQSLASPSTQSLTSSSGSGSNSSNSSYATLPAQSPSPPVRHDRWSGAQGRAQGAVTEGRSLADLTRHIDFIDEPELCDIKIKVPPRGPNIDKAVDCQLLSERDLSEAERKAMFQLDEVRSKLATKETEVNLLQADVNMLSADRDNKIVELEVLTAQIRKLREDNEVSLVAAKKIENQLEDLRAKNQQLAQELLETSEKLQRAEAERGGIEKNRQALEVRIKDLEKRVEAGRAEQAAQVAEHEAVEVEREEEVRALQNTIDDLNEQKLKLKKQYDHDLEHVRSAAAAQELQFIDDFEWKLRQIESSCKAKLIEKDKQTEEKLKEVRSVVEKEMIAEREKLVLEKRHVDEQMRQVYHYKAYEPELIQLRGLTHEQLKALRSCARQIDHLKFNEKLQHEELRAARALLDKEKNSLQVIQSTNQRRLEAQEEASQAQLEQQRNDLNSKWEDRMRAECTRLKQDLCKLHAEEKHLAVESMKLQKDQELSTSKQLWERQKQELLQSISKLKDTITEKESSSHREIEKVISMADQENWELRNQIEKLKNGQEAKIAKLKETHDDEMESLRVRHDNALKELSDVKKKLAEFQEKNKLLPIDPDSGKLTPPSFSSPVNKSDSGCGEDSSEEEEDDEDDDEEDEESEGEAAGVPIVPPPTKSKIPAAEPDVSHLREEVASLQGSIEKLTSNLTVGARAVDKPESDSSETETDSESEEDEEEEE